MNLRVLWHDLRASLWFRPLLWLGAISLLALAMLELDRRLLDNAALLQSTPWLFVDSAEGARTLLGAIATAMLTVGTLAFSILMLAVVQAANAYSPRILREYLADPGNQHVLGILVGIFLYALIVLRRIEDTEERFFLPMLAVSAAVILSLLAVIAFIYFINHVAHSIEVSSIIRRIHEEAEELLAHPFPEGIGQPCSGPAGVPPGLSAGEGRPLLARRGGYIEAVDGQALLEILRESGAILRLEQEIGAFLLRNAPLATVWAPSSTSREDTQRLLRALQETITISNERTVVQDLHFSLQQLKDIALRALSPAVNDPRTAVNCIDALAQLLAELARRPALSPYRCDEAGVLRAVLPVQDFSSALDVAFLQLQEYAVRDSSTALRLAEVYALLAGQADEPAAQQRLWQHLGRFAFQAQRAPLTPWDRQLLNQELAAAANGLGRPASGLLLDDRLPSAFQDGSEAAR